VALQLTVACATPGAAATLVGASGTVCGITAFEAAESAPGPATFLAATLKVYVVPLIRPPSVTWVTTATVVVLSATPPT